MSAALKMREQLSRGEARAHRLKLQREIAAQLRRADRERLRDLKEKIRRAKEKRRGALKSARETCRAEKLALRDRLRARRERVMAELREAFDAERAAARNACALRQQKIRDEHAPGVSKAERILAEERQLMRELATAERRYQKKSRARSTATERRQESDDEVRGNLPPELVPVFNKVRRQIKAGPRKSRTEAFFEWAEANPGEVLVIQQNEADRDVARLIREYEQQAREVKKPRRYKRSPEELAADLADVPF